MSETSTGTLGMFEIARDVVREAKNTTELGGRVDLLGDEERQNAINAVESLWNDPYTNALLRRSGANEDRMVTDIADGHFTEVIGAIDKAEQKARAEINAVSVRAPIGVEDLREALGMTNTARSYRRDEKTGRTEFDAEPAIRGFTDLAKDALARAKNDPDSLKALQAAGTSADEVKAMLDQGRLKAAAEKMEGAIKAHGQQNSLMQYWSSPALPAPTHDAAVQHAMSQRRGEQDQRRGHGHGR